MESFESELCRIINKYSMDNRLNTPDFILTQYIVKHLEALEELNSSVNFHYNGDSDVSQTVNFGVATTTTNTRYPRSV